MAKVRFDIRKLKKFAREGTEKLERVARMAVLDAGAKIVELTPVDTGFARAGWFPTVNGQQTGTEIAEFSFSGMKLGDTIGVANRVEYIWALENGHSKQAALGMVRVTAALWPQIVSDAAKRVRKS